MRLLFLFTLLISFPFINFAQKGIIAGKVIDQNSGQPLTSATVLLIEKNKTTVTDINGRFTFTKLDSGSYTIKCSYAGYTEKIIEEIKVDNAKDIPELVVALKSKKDLENVVISSTRLKAAGETVASLLVAQKNNASVSDGISAEIIKKTPDKSTSDVLKRISGATIQDERFVVIRGLNDRYNASYMNGAPLPSTESDRKAFAFDILPSATLDNLVIYKTATPDKSGEFAGGLIEVSTKSAVAKNFLLINFSTSYNSLATGNTRYFSENAGNKDWIGIDDGTRKLPKGIPSASEFRNVLNFAQRAELTKLFNKYKWGVLSETTRPAYNFQISKSFKINKKGEEFIGGLVSANYSRNYTFSTGNRNSYDYAILGPNQEPFQKANYVDSSYNEEVIVALMANMSMKLNSKNTITFKNILSINTDNRLIKRFGQPDYAADSLTFVKEAVRYYTTNQIFSSQLAGNHVVFNKNTRFNWIASYSKVDREIPNLSRTSYVGNLLDKDNLSAVLVTPPNQNSGSGSMFFSTSLEDIYSVRSDVSHSYSFLKNISSTAKIGIGYQKRKRNFTSRVLGFSPYNNGAIQFDNSLTTLPEDQIFLPEHMGLLPNGKGGFILSDGTLANSDYDASSYIMSGYLMNEQKIKNKLRLIYGVRLENFNQQLSSIKNLRDTINLDTTVLDVLPSVNIVYGLTSKINFRIAYSQTVNRPEFRELAPFLFYDYGSNFTIEGQPTLKRAKISNYDFRFEWYPGNAQLFSVSAFYKDFTNPIEILSIPNTTNQAIYINTSSATTYGIESEFRLNLATLIGKKSEKSFAGRWTFSGNFAWIKSKIKVDSLFNIDPELLIRDRAMQGQSPYIINGGVTYNDEKSGFSTTLSVNRAGERILIAGTRISPSIYERSRTVADLQVSKFFMNKFLELKFTVKDLLAQKL